MMDRRFAGRLRAFLVGALVAGCTPVSQSFNVHSAELSCDEANRHVYAAVGDMGMKVTSFTQAQAGRPGYLAAVGSDRRGEVTITCTDAGVVVDPRQTSFGDKVFERGIFLSVSGRSGMRMDGARLGGEKPVGELAEASTTEAPAPTGIVLVKIEPQRGFEAVLDFDADLAAAGVLPVKITLSNGSRRAYSFSVSNVTLRLRSSGETANRLTAAEATAKIEAKAGSGGAQTSVGNVASATKIMAQRELGGGKLAPGASMVGFLYYPVADYDRAKVQMTDVQADELESFLVDF